MPALFLNRIMKLTIKIVICYFTTHEHWRRGVPSRFMRKIVCRLRLNEVSRQ